MPLIEIFKGSSRKKHELALEEIIEVQKRHNLTTDDGLIRRAFDLAMRVHEKQKRKDGTDYIVHPLAVARTCAEYWLDDVSIAGALLHDTVEDAEGFVLTRQDIENDFGPEVANIVEGVTKLKGKDQDPLGRQIETLKKLLASAAREDIRTIIIKIFDRHDNVKSIDVFRKLRGGSEKQSRIEYETRRFYVPIAARLGLFKIAREMEDSLMRALDAATYFAIQKWVAQQDRKVRPQVENIVQQIRMSLEGSGVDCIEKFYHRGFYQIYEQLEQQKMGLENLENATAFNLTLIVPNEDDCYRTLGVVHQLYPHLRDSIFDYINNPKINGYQSLHTVILVPGMARLQVLIRTPEMDTRNHLGLIANMRGPSGVASEELVNWIQKLVSSFDVIGQKDFLDITSKVLFEEIELVTPKGEQVLLPVGSTVLDFAFYIHSEVAIHARHAEVDGKERKLNTVLKKGQRIKIITDDKPQAQPHWFSWVSNSTSRLALKKYFKKEQKKLIEEEGEKLLAFCKDKLGIRIDSKSPMFEELQRRMGYETQGEFLEDLYTGRLMYEYVIPQLVMAIGFRECKRLCKLLDEKGVIRHDEAQDLIRECTDVELKESLKNKINSDIAKKVSFSEYVDIPKLKFPLPIHFARCCHPQSHSSIVALTSKGKGAVIHRSDCGSIYGLKEFGSANLADARWKKNPAVKKVFIRFEGNDRPNLLHDLTHLFHDVRSNILEISVKVLEGNKFVGEVLLEISDVINQELLTERFSSVRSLQVIDVRIVQ